MVFSSITFLYLFLPICLISYFLTPKKFRNYTLLVFSLIFYGFETPSFILMMIFCIFIAYINGIFIEKYHNKIHFLFSVVFSLTPLFFFKYANFFIKNTNNITSLDIPLLKVVMPLGISFYTFQMMTYLVDVWHKQQIAEKNIFNFALYVSFFPQLIAGPILKYSDVQKQILNRKETLEKFSEGIFIFIIGLGKKILIANQLGELVSLYNANTATVVMTWLYAISYSLQLYFDFSGYSTMAIGIAKMFGFELPINFNYPYICTSVKDFWKRWHITLSSFFKDYVYIPMGGSRVSVKRYIFNLFVVWFLTGFWHGADWIFIMWGLMFFVALLVEKFIIKDRLNKNIHRILSLFIVMVSFIFFNAPDILTGFTTVKGLFIGTFIDNQTIFILRNFLFIIILGIFGATPIIYNFYLSKIKNNKISIVVEPLFVTIVLFLSTAYLVDGVFNPFLYFKF